ncbi:MAG TPA: iron-sulfur cluster assembly accessory protein [Macromonas sp.]|nr:iron-sulfur cluster assembly accessory protein [Macromonas sp.]
MATASISLTVTSAAEKFIRRMVRFSTAPHGGMRLVVTPGGCSGLSSAFTVEPAPQEGDAELSISGLRLFLPAESRLLLDGVTMDFIDTPLQSGLTFLDPKQSACGCSNAEGASAPPAQATVGLDALRRVARH